MGIFSFSSKRVNKKDHLGKRQSLIWSITLAGYRRQVGDLVQTLFFTRQDTFPLAICCSLIFSTTPEFTFRQGITWASHDIPCQQRLFKGSDNLSEEWYTLSGTTFQGRGSTYYCFRTSPPLKPKWRQGISFLTRAPPALETGVKTGYIMTHPDIPRSCWNTRKTHVK